MATFTGAPPRNYWRGPKLITVVPEQATLQTERALLASGVLAGAVRAEVLSFRRLAHRILSSTPPGPSQLLSTSGRVMALQTILVDSARRLLAHLGG